MAPRVPPQAGSTLWQPVLLKKQHKSIAQLEPVAGGVYEVESALKSKACILDSSSASLSFSFLSCSASCSMS